MTSDPAPPTTTRFALPRLHELDAPADWQSIEFLSDLHLSAEAPRTFDAWASHLRATDADAVFILGDLFEVWVGDDARHDSFEARCLDELADCASRRHVAFMAGNRDFLVGAAALREAGVAGLADPTVLTVFDRRWLLTHGDALCIADAEYQRFRAQVRGQAWQDDFLARPLAERRRLARQMRDASRDRQRGQPASAWADVDAAMAAHWLREAKAHAMIHGHTHRPGRVELGPGLERHVLSDWDFDAGTTRGDVLRLDASGLRRIAPRATVAR